MLRLAAALLMTAPAGAYAQEAAPDASLPVPADEGDKEAGDTEIVVEGEKPKRVCQTERVTGSIRSRRVCRTIEQVAADTERAGIIKDRLLNERQTRQHVADSLESR